jgi:hypothetical protein
MRSSIAVLAAIALTACTVDGDDPVTPDLGVGKGDAIDQVEDRGALELEVARTGAFTEDLQFDGYHLAVRDGARVRIEITRLGTAKALDTTLFVFGPSVSGAFGTTAVAFDDDSGWGKQSRLTNLELEGGEYLVVVGTHDARGRGAYRLLTTCQSGECDPLPAPTGCDESVGNAILACVDLQVADSASDPESPALTHAEALEICTDGEALGPVFDAQCGGPSPAAFCEAGFEAFATGMGPACREELAPFAVECVFGDTFRDLQTSRDVISGTRRVLTSAEGLDEIEQQQVILAVQSSAHTDVTTIDEAFERADQGEINQIELWDRTSARAYVVYEFGAGDTSVGAYFVHATTERVAVIGDGDLERCSAARGPQGNDCTSDADCSVGTCFGDSEPSPVGRCTVLSGFGEQTDCSVDAPCDIEQGLICAGLTRGDEGQCFPAWMRGGWGVEFGFEEAPAIPDADPAGVEHTFMVNGLATVDTDVEIDLFVDHPDASQLRITLTNPAGAEVLVFDGDAPEVFLRRHAVLGFSGDEMVNGPWTLRVIDQVAGGTGSLSSWNLRLGSRFD